MWSCLYCMQVAPFSSTNACELVLFNKVKREVHPRYPPPPHRPQPHAHTLKWWDASLNPTSSNQLILSGSWTTFQQNQLGTEVVRWGLHFREGERTSLCLQMSPEAARTRSQDSHALWAGRTAAVMAVTLASLPSRGLITTWHHWLVYNCFKWTVSSWITTTTLLGSNIRLNYRRSQEA